MDNATILAEAEIRRRELAQEPEAPAETAGAVLDRLSAIKTRPTANEKESSPTCSNPNVTDVWVREAWAKANVPKRHSQLDIDTLSVHTEWSETRKKIVARDQDAYLYALIGPRGTGKTQMAVSLLHSRIFALGRTGRYLTAMDFFMMLKESFREGEKRSEMDVLQSLILPNLLVIDEITVRSDSVWENNLFTYLVNKRYDALKDTILIGNCANAQELTSCVGPSISSRMQETGGILLCQWASFRRGM